MKNRLSFTSVLTIGFIILKVANLIDWSWIWVLSPLWISFLITALMWLGIWIYEKTL